MKLSDWLQHHGMSRVDFARRVSLSPSAVTQLCNHQGAWLSRDTAELIVRETGGAVTPNDFMDTTTLQSAGTSKAATLPDAVAAFARGEFVIVTDDDDRENEGDLFIAASKCTPERMAFMIRHTSGIVCAPVAVEVARRLRLDPMVAVNDAPLGTAFTVSVDARRGLTTGISAEERTATVRALALETSTAADFVRPGHIFPLVARAGGVLMRSGHTEACIDLCRLAEVPPVGVLAEVTRDDGTVMRGPEIAAFGERNGIVRISVADMIAYRQSRERLVQRVSSYSVATEFGEMTGHTYVTPFDSVNHQAFVLGDVGQGRDLPARLHRANAAADVLGGAKVVKAALQVFSRHGRVVLVYLWEGGVGVPSLAVADAGPPKSEAVRRQQWREVGLGAQILRDLGVVSIRNLVVKPHSYVALAGFGIEIVATEVLEPG